MEFITYEVEGQVGIITINRPKALNALNSAVLDELDATIDGVDLDAVRCLILTGAGEKSFEDLMKEINEGLIITDLAGLHSGANTVSGDFSLAAKGFYVKNGEKTFPVEQITVAGNFFTLLTDIEEVGNDLKFPMSSVGSPSIMIKELSIAGEGSKNE